MFAHNTSNLPKKSQTNGKKSLELLKTSSERKKYANDLMERVKGHIPVILEATKDLPLELNDSNKV